MRGVIVRDAQIFETRESRVLRHSWIILRRDFSRRNGHFLILVSETSYPEAILWRPTIMVSEQKSRRGHQNLVGKCFVPLQTGPNKMFGKIIVLFDHSLPSLWDNFNLPFSVIWLIFYRRFFLLYEGEAHSSCGSGPFDQLSVEKEKTSTCFSS